MQVPNDVEPGTKKLHKSASESRGWLVTVIVVILAVALSAVLWINLSSRTTQVEETKKTVTKPNTVDLNKENAQEIKTITVSSSRPSTSFSVTATVEANQQELQQITPLVSGRIRNIYVSLGDNVQKGELLLTIDSPQVAELHGKLHEAETRLHLARLALKRVNEAASRVNVLKSKASLDEADSTLQRTKQLVSEGLIARKDLVAAQSNYDKAKADYEFQKNISLNREVAEAQAEYSTATTESEHLKDGLRALDAKLPVEEESKNHDISMIELRSPITGTVIERFVNPGSGIEQGKPLLTIANTSTLWVIANVPEKEMTRVRIGTSAQIFIGATQVPGKVNYIDPRLNEDTRTARVRLEIKNPGNKLQAGNFAQVEFQEASDHSTIYVPEAAVQILSGDPVVFVRLNNGEFVLRKVKTGPTQAEMVPISGGLKPGEVIATEGSFVLKSKLLKEQFGNGD